MNGLKIGQRVTVANVELEVSAVCDPCELIEAIRPGLQAAMMGKRGMLCRVLPDGVVKAGDGICVGEDNVQEAVEAPFAENAQDKRSARRSAPRG